MGVKKYLFAIFAAIAALAFVGASSASATVLCAESATSECASYGGVVIDASLTGSTTFSTTGGTLLDTCTSGTIESAVGKTGGSSETVSAPIGDLTWGSCTKTTDTINKGELEIHWISGSDNGTVTGKNASVTVNTIFGSCTYGTGSALDLGTLKGGKPAAIEISAIVSKQAGSFACPAEAKWVASYSVTSVESLYAGGSPLAAAPRIRVENTGGVPTANTNRCEFSVQFEKCKVTVWNESGFPVFVTEAEIAGTNGSVRYGIIEPPPCKKGKEIPIGGSCTDEVILNAFAVKDWSNWYFIQVEGEGMLTAANAVIKTV